MDILIATALGRHPTQYQPLPHTFREYVQVLQNITKLSEEADELHDHADFCESLAHWNILNNEDDADPNVEALRLEAREARQKADKLVRFTNNFKIFTHHTDPSSFPFLHRTIRLLPSGYRSPSPQKMDHASRHLKGPFLRWGCRGRPILVERSSETMCTHAARYIM